MSVSEVSYKALILASLTDAGTLVQDNLDALWLVNAVTDNLQLSYLLTQQAAIKLLLMKVWKHVDFNAFMDLQEARSDEHKHLLDLWNQTVTEIANLQAGNSAYGTAEAYAIQEVGSGWDPDPNDPSLRGSPFLRPRLGWSP